MTNEELLTAADKVLNSRSIVPLAAVKCAEYVRRMLDETPCDETWLEPLCESVSDLKTYWILCDRDHCYVAVIRWSGGLHLKCGEVSVSERATRGQVRQLCAALGIELREEA